MPKLLFWSKLFDRIKHTKIGLKICTVQVLTSTQSSFSYRVSCLKRTFIKISMMLAIRECSYNRPVKNKWTHDKPV